MEPASSPRSSLPSAEPRPIPQAVQSDRSLPPRIVRNLCNLHTTAPEPSNTSPNPPEPPTATQVTTAEATSLPKGHHQRIHAYADTYPLRFLHYYKHLVALPAASVFLSPTLFLKFDLILRVLDSLTMQSTAESPPQNASSLPDTD